MAIPIVPKAAILVALLGVAPTGYGGSEYTLIPDNERRNPADGQELMERSQQKESNTPPYPHSPVITGVKWAPRSEILRFAKGSDNWPLTWADDGHLYGACGDGDGFHSNRKSSWICRIMGDPPEITGEDLANLGEGDGRRGRKACSLLCLDGVLYMLVRNANLNGRHCQLACSTDHGRNWEWEDWRFEEFGYCAFINYGKDYAGARDECVYLVSHDGPSAYEPAREMVLMRVPKGKIRDRTAYEIFAGTDSGEPAWTADFARRQPVFEHFNPWLCRSSISYNAGLKRYLWWQQTAKNDEVDSRREGGFAVYDAPEPWGPWTTVFYAERWDTGPGETGCFPT